MSRSCTALLQLPVGRWQLSQPTQHQIRSSCYNNIRRHPIARNNRYWSFTSSLSSSMSQSSSPFTTTTTAPIMTPAEAGRRAQKILLQEEKEKRVKNLAPPGTSEASETPTPQPAASIETILSHSGFVPVRSNDHSHSHSHNNNPGDDDEETYPGGVNHITGRTPYPQNSTITPPIHLSTTFIRPVDGNYDMALDAIYIRDSNPTRLLFEQQMSTLELTVTSSSSSKLAPASSERTKASYSFAMSSGMMAISTVIMAHTLPIHILLPKDLYHGIPTMIENVLLPFCTAKMMSYERVDMRDPTKDLARTLQRLAADPDTNQTNVIVWIETPSNPLCHIIDIAHTCHTIRSNRPQNTTIVVDSTLAPPNITQPLLIRPTTPDSTTTGTFHTDGVDVVIHSGTKYIGGHSDTMGGIITVSPWTEQGRALHPKLTELQIHQGGILSSMDSYMMIRGLRTLHVRVERQSQSALALAQYLQDQMQGPYSAYIQRVYYPGLPPKSDSSKGWSDFEAQQLEQQQQQRQYDIASQQMMNGLYGSILSVEFDTESQAMAFIGGLQRMLRATSFGGTETVVEHRASIEPESLRTSPAGLVRISVGLENVKDLLDDLENAMRIMTIVCPSR